MVPWGSGPLAEATMLPMTRGTAAMEIASDMTDRATVLRQLFTVEPPSAEMCKMLPRVTSPLPGKIIHDATLDQTAAPWDQQPFKAGGAASPAVRRPIRAGLAE